MIDALSLDRELFAGTTRLVLDEVERRAWKAVTVTEGSSHIYIDRGDGKLVHIFGSTPPQQSYAAGHLSNNKSITSMVLEQAGIFQLPSIMVDPTNTAVLEVFMRQYGKVIIKPIDGAHGNGIRANITTTDEAVDAIVHALQFSQLSRVLVQKQFESENLCDIRILCIDGKFAAAIHRVPARVFGDGVHTVAQLIERENQLPHRGKAYKSPYAVIDEARALKYLGAEKSSLIPTQNEEVRVMDVANYGAGGELVDITDSIPEWMKREAEIAARACEIVVAGVDYLVSELLTPNTAPTGIERAIIEINKSPALMIHDRPHIGKNRQTVRLFMDLVETYKVV